RRDREWQRASRFRPSRSSAPPQADEESGGEIALRQLDAARKRIAEPQPAGEPFGEIDDDGAFASQPGAFHIGWERARRDDQRLGLIEEAIEHAAQAFACLRRPKLVDARAASIEILARQVDAIEIAVIRRAILQMVQHLECAAEGIGRRPGGTILAMEIEQLP